MSTFQVPLIVRGQIVERSDVVFGGRRGGVEFSTPDVRQYLGRLQLASPSSLNDLYTQSLDEIINILGAVGTRLKLSSNPFLQEAFEISRLTSGLSEPILRDQYDTLDSYFDPVRVREMVERSIGIAFLEGWVQRPAIGGGSVSVRAVGARAVHVVAGNSPGVSALSIVRGAVSRSDSIVKSPSNDPLTAAAIARTLIEVAPDNPITRHLSVAYWKGGDDEVEGALYQPKYVDKIIAWGGLASVSHISRYLRPGIDLITLDPKLSSTIIGREAFLTDAAMNEVARRLARDVGALNQEACVSARVVYIETGTDEHGVATANRFGEMLYSAIQALPAHVSGPATKIGAELADEIATLRIASDDYRVVGGGVNGGVIVSQLDEPVEFSRLLANRIANLVPVDDLEIAIGAVTAYTQTIGIYPESLKSSIRDRLALSGAQRLVSLGNAAKAAWLADPWDAIEPLRRMCKWIIDEADSDPTLPTATTPSARRT